MPKTNRRRKGGGNGGGGAEWSNTPDDYKIPDNLADAIGKQNESYSMADAWRESNPFFSYEYNEYSSNCQRVVMAYEMRRRGYDVEALPTYQGDMMPRGGNWQSALSGMTIKDVGTNARKDETVMRNIENQMQEWGEGSRAILRIHWAGTNSGHVINVERRNGKTYYYDAQVAHGKAERSIGAQHTDERLLKDYISHAQLNRTQLLRTDNARVTDEMRKMVRPSRKRY